MVVDILPGLQSLLMASDLSSAGRQSSEKYIASDFGGDSDRAHNL